MNKLLKTATALVALCFIDVTGGQAQTDTDLNTYIANSEKAKADKIRYAQEQEAIRSARLNNQPVPVPVSDIKAQNQAAGVLRQNPMQPLDQIAESDRCQRAEKTDEPRPEKRHLQFAGANQFAKPVPGAQQPQLPGFGR